MDTYLSLKRFFYDAFGVEECSTAAMQKAVRDWYSLYYDGGVLALPATIVRKLSRAVFAEARSDLSVPLPRLARALEDAMIGGEAYLKPVRREDGMDWICLPRNRILVFARDAEGLPTDVGLMEQRRKGRDMFTLLERRQRDDEGRLHICNRLFRSRSRSELGREMELAMLYPELPGHFTYDGIPGVGLGAVRMPMRNCVDGSGEGVSFYAAATELIRAAEENEAQLRREFENGRSRLVVSRDLLRQGQLKDDLFVALDEAADTVGITVFAPEIRHQCYLDRQQSYLRSIENTVGLKRGLLSQVEAVDRTATEITSSEGEYMTTILELRRVVDTGARGMEAIAAALEGREETPWEIHWGDGVV